MAGLVHTQRMVARYGGEEFAVRLPDVDPEAVREAAERLHRGLSSAPFAVGDGRLLPVTVSIGGVCMPDGSLTVPDLARIADQALYAAKDAGRKRVVTARSVPHDQADPYLRVAS